MCGSSGGDTTSTQKWEPPDFIKPYLEQGAQQIMPSMQRYLDNYPVYNGQRVADLTDTQLSAGQGITDLVYNNPWAQGTNNAFNTLTGGETTQAQRNQYAGAENKYAGDNPYLQSVIDKSNGDITKQYERSVAPQIASAQIRGSSFGSALGNMRQADSEKQLADSLAQNEGNLRMQNYNQSAGLEQQRLGSQQQLEQQYLGTQNQNQENAYQRMLGGLGMFPQLNQSALQNYGALMGFGDLRRSAQQDYLNAQQQQFNEQQFGPMQGAQSYLNFLRGFGGLGGTQVSQVPGTSPWGTIGGLGLTAAGLFGR